MMLRFVSLLLTVGTVSGFQMLNSGLVIPSTSTSTTTTTSQNMVTGYPFMMPDEPNPEEPKPSPPPPRRRPPLPTVDGKVVN